MSEPTLLSVLLWLPTLGIVALAFVPSGRDAPVRFLTLGCMLLQSLLGAVLYHRFDGLQPGLQFATDVPWIESWGVSYRVGLDGLNVLLVTLTVFLGPLIVLGAWSAVTTDIKLFHAMVLFIQFTMLGTFVAQDLFLFYVFWEAMLIPMFLIIGLWGGERRIYATLKFVLFTAFGSILMLAALIYLVLQAHDGQAAATFDLQQLSGAHLPLGTQLWLLAAFALAFAIKVPMFPLHTWLPDAHVEAPTTGSVILAGVLLKMGTYGFMKLGFPLFPDAARAMMPVIMTLAVISIVYGACLALVQDDIKKIIAYSSISHLGYVMLGLASLDLIGIQGAILQMVSHGLVAGGLFLMVGMIYERTHSRAVADYGGLAKMLPTFAVFFTLLTLASIGLPTTSGFAGEFMVLLGAFNAAWATHLAGDQVPITLAVIAVSGVVLGALYMLWLAQRILFGEARAPRAPLTDLNARETTILVAIVAAIFAIGLFPGEPLAKTEGAAREFQQRVLGETARLGSATP